MATLSSDNDANATITVQQHAFEGEHHLGGPQSSPQTTEAIIVTGGVLPFQVQVQVQPPAADQNLDDQFPGDNTAVADVEAQLGVVDDLTLVPNQPDPIGRLRLSATSTLFCAAMVGVLYLPGDLHGMHTIYGRVKLIASVGAPIVFAAFSLIVSFWLASDPVGKINWIKGLLMANVSMLSGPLAIYWALKRETKN
ncbi:hypothetical protein FCM35_KLT17284 [Carex littledalei]|uniref:Uncharacterized protein n=1 Tax=Carex littledalei TaxID=544730 RepID=A0A833RBQ1_9POAL|nr:hypothetical protein FCM35_KLT17284 [Carex littledalei]